MKSENKKKIAKELNVNLTNEQIVDFDLEHKRSELELLFSDQCYENQLKARSLNMPYKCTCPDTYRMTKTEIEKHLTIFEIKKKKEMQ
jgi:hypothetical protein